MPLARDPKRRRVGRSTLVAPCGATNSQTAGGLGIASWKFVSHTDQHGRSSKHAPAALFQVPSRLPVHTSAIGTALPCQDPPKYPRTPSACPVFSGDPLCLPTSLATSVANPTHHPLLCNWAIAFACIWAVVSILSLCYWATVLPVLTQTALQCHSQLNANMAIQGCLCLQLGSRLL